MNITTQPINTPAIATAVNQPTDALRRDNIQREMIAQPAALQKSAAEKGTASERDKARTPSQQNEGVDFEQLQKQAELANATISEQQQDETGGEQQHQQQSDSQENTSEQTTTIQNNPQKLTEEELAVVNELKKRDQEVRMHEKVHAATGGSFTGQPVYSFETGPDGRKYAVDGEVSVDMSPIEGDPKATIAKMRKVYSAALAPVEPSIEDKKIANEASRIIAEAQSQLFKESIDITQVDSSDTENGNMLSSDAELEPDFAANEFDQQIEKTLKAQEQIVPSRLPEMDKRNQVIESVYAKVTLAYDNTPTNQFEITA